MSLPLPELADEGLLLQAVLPIDELDPSTIAALKSINIVPDEWRSLVLTGQAGTTLWDGHVRQNLDRSDPFDDTSIELIDSWFAEHHSDADWSVVYPTDAPLPLGQLAQRVGWGEPSPLGLTIHPEFGLWMSHRVAFVTTLDLPATIPTSVVSPCVTCRGRPCETACPVSAVSLTGGFDVQTCAEHRAEEESACAFQCLARDACPVGAEHRYGDAQMHHHYASGLASIRRWLALE
jgi:hypothetical protein